MWVVCEGKGFFAPVAPDPDRYELFKLIKQKIQGKKKGGEKRKINLDPYPSVLLTFNLPLSHLFSFPLPHLSPTSLFLPKPQSSSTKSG